MKPGRPEAAEYANFYEKYIALVPGTDAVAALEAQRLHMVQALSVRSEREGNFRYGADKWSVKEIVGHLSDSERVFTYRAMRIARGDRTPLSGFEQDDYVRAGNFGERRLTDLAEEFAAVRSGSIALYRSLSEEAWMRRGVANNNEVSVRALAFITAGHELHHRQILEERYYAAIPRA
ncbi:MAG: DinB family protein [Acidobacteriota bacterium]|nr:DinB family protein [Acidobacteriota bacterium]